MPKVGETVKIQRRVREFERNKMGLLSFVLYLFIIDIDFKSAKTEQRNLPKSI